jgi:hypothetical protein
MFLNLFCGFFKGIPILSIRIFNLSNLRFSVFEVDELREMLIGLKS